MKPWGLLRLVAKMTDDRTLRLMLAGCLLSIVLHSAAVAATVQLAVTGQTSCWDSSGNGIPCGGTGQDGESQVGVPVPEPRFIDQGDGTVVDRLTDLVWLRNADCSGAVSWQQALDSAAAMTTGRCGLSDGSVTGDWRLPNRKELLSIMNFQQSNGASWLSSQGFINGIHGWYWSSDSYAFRPATKWVVHSVGAAWADDHPEISPREFHAMYVRDPGIPHLSVSPGQIAFGEVEVGTTAVPLALVLRNTGNAPLVIASIGLSGTDRGRFDLDAGTGSGGTCGTLAPTVGAGLECSIALSFTPGESGVRTAGIDIVPQGGDVLTVPVSGTGYRSVYQVVATASDDRGSVSPARSEIPGGESAAIVVTPAEGYRPDTAVGGTCPGGAFEGMTYTTGAITGDCTAIFTFVLRTFTVSTVIHGNGDIACDPADPSPYLTPVSCSVRPADGYAIGNVAIDGIDQAVANPDTFVHAFGPISADHTIEATFVTSSAAFFAVTPLRAEHGTVTPQEPQYVPAGSSMEFVVSPASGYHIDSVTGCGGRLEEDRYTTGPVTGNCTVEATFAPDGMADAIKAFRSVLGFLRLTSLEQRQYDVAPLGPAGNPQPDGRVTVGDVVIMLRRLVGLIDW